MNCQSQHFDIASDQYWDCKTKLQTRPVLELPAVLNLRMARAPNESKDASDVTSKRPI